MVYNKRMQGSIIQEILAGYDCSVYLPATYKDSKQDYPVVYVLGESSLAQLATLYENARTSAGDARCKEAIIVGINVQKWEKDFSPWEANALSEKSEPFAGGAGHFLYILETQIKTFIDKNFRTQSDIEQTYLVGYSLAGLAVLYSLYTSPFALHYASVSGSLWFPKWTEFAEQNKLLQLSESDGIKIYLSLGKAESSTSNMLMSKVDDCTQRTFAALKEKVAMLGQKPTDVFFEYNDGGHLANAPERTVRAITHLLSEA